MCSSRQQHLLALAGHEHAILKALAWLLGIDREACDLQERHWMLGQSAL